MTVVHSEPANTARYDDIVERFRPQFDQIAATAVTRDRDYTLPFDEIGQLKKAGIGSLRIPAQRGGAGLGFTELFRLLVELAAADSNIPQALRSHIMFTETVLYSEDSAWRDRWLARIAGGVLVGNAISERGSAAPGRVNTTLTEHHGGFRLSGTKYYTTGSLFADWIQVTAETPEGTQHRVLVRADAPGVVQHDDWSGFGQRTTSSGTIEFTDVEVDPDEIIPGEERRTFRPAVAQLVLLACLAGVARNATLDAAQFVRNRRRSYTHASASLPKDDPLVQQLVGTLHSSSFAAEATVHAAAASLERGLENPELLEQAEIDVSQAHVVLVDQVLAGITKAFDVGGASIVDRELGLDRHWRNARTLAVHNPVLYKARAVGDWVINGTEPIYRWKPGTVAS